MWPPPLSQFRWLGQAPEGSLGRRIHPARQLQDQAVRLTVHGQTFPDAGVQRYRPPRRCRPTTRTQAQKQKTGPELRVRSVRYLLRDHTVELRGFEPLTFSSRRARPIGSIFLGRLRARLAESSSPAEDSHHLTPPTLTSPLDDPRLISDGLSADFLVSGAAGAASCPQAASDS